jgi:uncharacterized Zn finger protein (UPF0148 family)
MKKLSKRQLLVLRGNRCEICGIGEWQGKAITFDEHHCDRNRENIVESNRIILCPNCHRQQHLQKSEEHKEKNRLAHLGKHASRETLEKLSIAKRGINNPMYGRTGESSHRFGCHLSEETKRKIRLTKLGQNNPWSKTNREKRKLQTGATL